MPGSGDKMEVDGATPSRALHVGTQALGFRRDGMETVSPFKDGVLAEWDVVEGLFDHAFK
jgi:actin-like protein 6A